MTTDHILEQKISLIWEYVFREYDNWERLHSRRNANFSDKYLKIFFKYTYIIWIHIFTLSLFLIFAFF